MGSSGTEVARQAADVVLLDDDFATLVEALVEGRGFWRNMRTALGLLLGGNAGELGVIAGASVMGFGAPLDRRQILIVNMITDALPSLAIVLQKPEHRTWRLWPARGCPPSIPACVVTCCAAVWPPRCQRWAHICS